MNQNLLRDAVIEIKGELDYAIVSASYANHRYNSGLDAKTALIRSENLIQRIHEVAKQGIHDELAHRSIRHKLYPPLREKSPEINIWGLLKKKKQDLVVLVGELAPRPEEIQEGPLKGQVDEFGREATNSSIVIGIRSQLSSVAKNFDTLMERTFAETINLRLRHPGLVMGEVYMLAVKDYDDQLMKKNRVAWKSKPNDIEKFISIFNGLSGRGDSNDIMSFYKYERCALLLVDFSMSPPKIYATIEELREDGIVGTGFSEDFCPLAPTSFCRDLVEAYLHKHPL